MPNLCISFSFFLPPPLFILEYLKLCFPDGQMHGLYYPMALDTNLWASVGYWGRGAWDQTLLWDHTCKSWYQIGMFWWWWSQSRDQHLWVVIHSIIKALKERSFVEEWTYENKWGFVLSGWWVRHSGMRSLLWPLVG